MQAVISVLDERHFQAVTQLWKELEREFGIRATSERVPFPHLTYQGAASYEARPLHAALQQIAREIEPFEIETGGLGIFTGDAPVLYIPVVESPLLTRLHGQIWQALQEIGREITTIYGPDHWIPHITLAQWDITHAQLPDVVQLLSKRTFSWRITIANLTVIETINDEPDAAYTISTQVALKK